MSDVGILRLSDFGARVGFDAVPPTGCDIRFSADPAARQALTAALGLAAVATVTADLQLRRHGRGLRLSGSVDAAVTQTCVVSLEPVDARVREEVAIVFVPPEDLPGEQAASGTDGEDDIELLEEGGVPVGAVIRDTVSLGLDPYPRAPGVALPREAKSDTDRTSPFAVLGKLKSRD